MSKKKIAIVITSIALTATVAVGGTLAYLTAQPAKVTNTFTVGSNLTGELKEPSWDGGGNKKAEHIVPNLTIPKDPKVTNTSDDQDAWVAIKLDCTCGNLSGRPAYDAIFGEHGFATLDKDGAWTQSSTDPTVFYLNATLKAKATSAPAFTAVKINKDATYSQLQNFTIDVTAYLVQYDTFNDSPTAMNAAFGSVFQ